MRRFFGKRCIDPSLGVDPATLASMGKAPVAGRVLLLGDKADPEDLHALYDTPAEARAESTNVQPLRPAQAAA